VSSPLYPADLGTDLAAIRRLAEHALAAAGRRAAVTTIAALTRVLPGGQVAVENADGISLVRLGSFTTNTGDAVTGVQLARPGGQEALVIGQDTTTGAFLCRLVDGHGASVIEVGDDGLTRPYLPVVFAQSSGAGFATITSATPTTQFAGRLYRQHSHLTVTVGMSVAAANTCEIDLFDENDGTVLVSETIPGAFNGTATLTALVPGAHMSVRTISLRAARTVGAGSVLVRPTSAYGHPAP
jgi:hypothetical protein